MKANPWKLIQQHYRTLRDYRTDEVRLADWALFVGVPVAVFAACLLLDLHLPKGASVGLLTTAGVLTAPFLTVQPGMGLMPMIKAFSIVIVGGLGSVRGSIVAALLLGYAETLIAYKVSTSWTELVSLAAVFTTLVLRPAGLFGIRTR